MRIYSMTATFGKLEHETLTLQPGLNIIEAPNEWGKSTWCAFLVTMLYGIDTRAKTTKTALADKERYAPWSGSPMSGRMDLNWNGRDITIERRTKGRSLMGDFRAYETESGLAVPELTAANCGEQLLGVERSVFTRAGFLKFSDLPVTQDDALRSRLNALVTTGDESGSAELLSRKLRELKNNCRYNRTGRLPEAEAQRDVLERKLREQQSISDQSRQHHTRRKELEQWMGALENHKAALRYAAAKDDARRVAAAAAARDAAQARCRELETICADYPDRQEVERRLDELEALRQAREALQMEEQMLPDPPEAPEPPEIFRGLTPEQAAAQVDEDQAALDGLREPPKSIFPLFLLAGLLALAAGVALAVLRQLAAAIPVLIGSAVLLIIGLVMNRIHKGQTESIRARRDKIFHRYGNSDPGQWTMAVRRYEAEWDHYQSKLAACARLRGDLDSRKEQLHQRILAVTDGTGLMDKLNHWSRVIDTLDALGNAHRDHRQAENHLQTLQAMAKTAQPAPEPDSMTFSEDETNRLLSDAAYELRQLDTKLGQCQGQMDTLGSSEGMQKELDAVNRRIDQLELTYAALDYAQKALTAATAELQRRFAPRISRQAQELFGQLTGGRYDRLTLGQDLGLHIGAQGEDTIRSQQWRSDGTVDQLYLALRLAVARELTPNAPLILDDALIRFDDRRLAAAMDILRRESDTKQVILFTCQGREMSI